VKSPAAAINGVTVAYSAFSEVLAEAFALMARASAKH
jgi:hypothetical protein